jgi:hypothetical protein
MRTTVDIPDAIYRELKARAALEGKSVKELILRRVVHTVPTGAETRKKLTFPAIEAKNPGSLKLGPEDVYDYIPFP